MTKSEIEGGKISELSHPEIIAPDSEFTVIVDTVDSAGTVVEVESGGFDLDITTSHDDVVANNNGRVEFIDRTEGESTYVVDVDVLDGADGETGTVRSWVNAEKPADADYEQSSQFRIDDEATENANGEITLLDHPNAVPPTGELTLTIESKASTGTIVDFDPDGFEVNMTTSDTDLVKETGNKLEFIDLGSGNSVYDIGVDILNGSQGDTIGISSWVNSESQMRADDERTSDILLGDVEPSLSASGDVISPGGKAKVTIEASGINAVELDGLWVGMDILESASDFSRGTFNRNGRKSIISYDNTRVGLELTVIIQPSQKYGTGDYLFTIRGSGSGDNPATDEVIIRIE
ncbi:hypothetical protein Huta_2149 [Halorhabdus utahensis DSM 12940]|uniref:Uncharacterized protein n=1 Tax=Halorhabdus utahensis (strain DSM 12940 / JCM 11049 / AX-2) TaxID=519442 RepID=C7NU71_HALUD|nr:hypothetical protein [Halorhabdus utahensis]ACV12316.1 hypothetical protein Huta_2149 [Halorhabdus utahensis DSM 12940]